VGAHRDFFGTLDLVRDLPLFRDLHLFQIEAIAAATTERHVAAGTELFRIGDVCDGVHVVVLGRVKLALRAPGGAEKVIEVLGPGASFGESAMFMGKPHMLYAEALTDSLLILIRKNAFLKAVENNPRFARHMLDELSARLCRLVADIEAYTLKDATERVTGYLLAELANGSSAGQHSDVALAASKGVLASRLNITREHFSRILHELSEAGLIRVSGRNIHIIDAAGLRERVA
jgi:CRP/FNR family transcriptional regulator, dissimilatory nitrate respiration regulator